MPPETSIETHSLTRGVAILPAQIEPPMPKVSVAIYVALIQAVIGLLVAFGLDVSNDLEAAIVQLVTVLAVAIPAWDAWVRGNRARYFAAKASSPTVNVTQENQA